MRGVYLKTLDYFKELDGISGCPVDRYVMEFVNNKAGIATTSDKEVKAVVDIAAEILRIDKSALDHSM